MADSTTLLAQITAGQAQKEVTANGLFDAASPATAYGRHAESCSGLTWAYYGTRYGGSSVASGTNACGASTTTYMVVTISTGAVSFATSTTNWNATSTYGRAYKIVTGTDSVTSYEDHRFGPSGILSSSGVGASVQAWDADLDAIAALSASNDDIIQRKSGAWANRTVVQYLADLNGTGLDADSAGFRGIPQNAQTGNYTTVAADAGKHIYHASGAGSGDTYTIDSNANVAYEIGTAITFVNMASDSVDIAITSDTMYLAGTGTTGSRTLAQYGVATALKLTSTTWVISGSGLT